jgi:hypothetical protein
MFNDKIQPTNQLFDFKILTLCLEMLFHVFNFDFDLAKDHGYHHQPCHITSITFV